MAFDAQKQIRENTLELQEFLKDLKQWETRVKEKDKSLNSKVQDAVSKFPPVRGQGGSRSRHDVSQTQPPKTGTKMFQGQVQEKIKPATAAKHTYDYFHDKWDKFDVDSALKEVDDDDSPSQEEKKKRVQEKPTIEPMSGNGFSSVLKSRSSDPFIDATTEKEMGNKFFKEKKFVQAIEHYSQSIALQPSAVSYANRAMAHIKIRRFREAEADCTEALALDDRYVKAYSRRGTARKELGNFLGAVSDAEFALRLEPDNKELKEQYTNAKAMCEKMMNERPEEKKIPIPIEEIQTISNVKPAGEKISGMNEPRAKEGSPVPSSHKLSEQDFERQKSAEKDKEAIVAAQAVAASIAAARATKHATMAVPKSFYEFEVVWKSFSSNSAQQAELLKVIKPSTLPQLFKDNLSPKLLGEILRVLGHFFPDNASQAIEIMENLTMAKRFNITAMCFTSNEKTELQRLWEEVFTGSQVDEDKVKFLSKLRAKFQL